jgi:hypothetical protein
MKSEIFEIDFEKGGLKPVTDAILSIGQIVFLNGYGQTKQGHERQAIYEIDNSNDRIKYKAVNLDKPAKRIFSAWEIKPGTLLNGAFNAIGIYYNENETATPEEITEGLSKANEATRLQAIHEEERSKINEEITARGKLIWEANKPADAKAVIVAELRINDSDSMTVSAHTGRRIILAFSNHDRDLFPEMRKAADKFTETQHLGTGKGIFRPAILETKEGDNTGYSKHYVTSQFRHLLINTKGYEIEFQTRAECQAYIDSIGNLGTSEAQGQIFTYEFEIKEDKIEHREKHIGGHGYYLGKSSYSGWTVTKETFSNYTTDNQFYHDAGMDGGFIAFKEDKPAAVEHEKISIEAGNYELVDYSEKALAVFGDTKPIKDELKGLGGRFNAYLQHNGGKCPGWVFSKKLEAELKALLKK